MKTSWQTTRDGSPQWLYVEADSVTIGSGQGHLEMGSSCSHEEFLAGQWHGEIAALYGAEGLAEVIASVKAAKVYAPFVEKLTSLTAPVCPVSTFTTERSAAFRTSTA